MKRRSRSPDPRATQRTRQRPLRQRGAALLLAMLTVALVATLAAAALWQQWRDVEVEIAERQRAQAAWMLAAAQDWARLILREDFYADRRSNVFADTLSEPWAVPLQEARLSTFLAAQGMAAGDSAADASRLDSDRVFLSGRITDAQARLNINNLVNREGVLQPKALAQFARLFALLDLPRSQLDTLAEGLRQAWSRTGLNGPLLPQTPEQLLWLGVVPQTAQRLAPYVALLPPISGGVPVNVNTAGVEVLQAALPGSDRSQLQRLLARRQTQPFATIKEVGELLGDDATAESGVLAVQTQFFFVQARLRLDDTTVQDASLVQRDGLRTAVLWRVRGVVPQIDTP